MAYDTTEAVAKFLSGFQMEITHRGKGTFTPDHVKYSLTIANGGKTFPRPSSRTLMFTANPPSRKSLVPSHPMRWLFVTTGWMSS